MTEIQISQQDIENVGQTLEGITDEHERALLAGILAVAAKAIRGGSAEEPPEIIYSSEPGSPVVVKLDDSLPSFSAQIAAAFTPGAIVEVDDDAEDAPVDDLAAIRVGHVASLKVGPGA